MTVKNDDESETEVNVEKKIINPLESIIEGEKEKTDPLTSDKENTLNNIINNQ